MKKIDLNTEANLKRAAYNTRRHFLKSCMSGMGAIAFNQILAGSVFGKSSTKVGELSGPHYPAKAKNVIFLHMAGAPSQLELFDYKPELAKLDGKICPPSLLEGKRFAFIKGQPKILGPQATFQQYGQSGAMVSNYLPEFSKMVDEVAFLKAMYTEEFNHAPAQLLMQTGSPRLGRPAMGSWVTYGLGSENDNLPAFIVLVSGSVPSAGKSIWGSGFLPTVYQGVQCRSIGEPVLFLDNPIGVDSMLRQESVNVINKINELEYQESRDPEILTRISQYELAFKMQTSVPEVMDIKDEPEWIHELYGTEPGKESFANNCLLARRLVEKGVRFVQLFDRRWDTHGVGPGNGVGSGLKRACTAIDKPISALLKDLKQRGLLEETLVVWGGEFGRTPMMEARTGKGYDGRDHHPDAFTMWMAGGGTKPGVSIGETDELGFMGIKDRTHVHDFQATILHLLGLNHEKLTYAFQGRDFRLTDVHGKVISKVCN
ncbi:DUF1501 domain-containing protein [Flexithrix dorotheae]|uniref:DUF1501 domain-containing protein n=1 Tax=Flexithrix dorotheae TaxID=70993 RepID=UPI0003652C3E|nr:DUF1501 domain-containing protein [Flexithrix dorotheae]